MSTLFRKLFAEAIGTFALVFAGTGAIVTNDVAGGSITHVGIALTFGLVVMSMIFALGDISGAHFNPAVTIGFWLARRLSARDVLPYVAAQSAGAIVASLALRALFAGHATLGTTLPHASIGAGGACLFEAILTALLMFVILNVATGSKEKGITAGIAIGGVVGLEAMFAGPVCGASMNPARSLAPALVSGHWEYAWAYIVGPLAGAVVGMLCFLGVRKSEISQNFSADSLRKSGNQ